jgi:hypothetical protein
MPPQYGQPHNPLAWEVPTGQPVVRRLEVFLSHATGDAEHIALVRPQIEALGISVYAAEDDPKPGTVLVEKLEAAIERCSAVIVLLTGNSVESAFVQQEIGIARRCGKPIVPIVEKGIDTRKLGILQGIEYLELDLAHPAETLAKMTASLQPLVVDQLKAMNVSVAVTQTTVPDFATAALLVGLGVILGLLIFSAISSQGGGGA